MDVDYLLMMLSFKILFVTLASMRVTGNFNYDRLDESSSWVADLGGRIDFQLAAVGRQSGHLFVAARDRLLEVDTELNLVHSVSVVPRCRRNKQHRQLVTPCSPHNNATLLTLLPTTHSADTGPDGMLLHCGTDQDRRCELFSSLDLSALRQHRSLEHDGGLQMIVEDSVDVCVVVITSPSPDTTTMHHIYIATSTVGNNDASIRGVSLRRDRLSNSYHVTPRHNAEGRLDVRRRSSWRHFVFRFVAGFDYNGFVYFVTVQREFPTARRDSSLVTRLVRLCPRDVEFQSYTELTLECRPLTGSSMTGPATAAQLAFKAGADAQLFILFGSSTDVSSSSALCVYSMHDIVRDFVRAQTDCYLGHGELVDWIVSTYSPCQRDQKKAAMINESFCGDGLNGGGIKARYPLETTSSWESNSVFGTSLIISTQNNFTVAIIGTADGRLLKVPVDDVTLAARRQFADVKVSDDELRDLVSDSHGHYVYAVTSRRISRLVADSCSLYADCESCVSSQDLLGCVWCAGRCVARSECRPTHFDPTQPYDTHCPPVILHFTPHSGPTSGGTLITVHGQRFGNGTLSEPDSNATVRIGSAECSVVFRNSTVITCQTGRVSSSINRDLRLSVSDSSKTTSIVNIRGSATSDNESFAYKEVSLSSVEPVAGPRSGGTQLTFVGTNLDVGVERSVSVAGLPCAISRSSSGKLVCTTSAYHADHADDYDDDDDHGLITLVIDGVQLDLNHTMFTYTDDPVITDVQPATSFVTGGLEITVSGHHLNVVQKPYIHFSLNGSYFRQDCEAVLNGESMTCLSPHISTTTQDDVAVDVHFKMDDVNLNQSSFELLYVRDPSIFPANTSCTALPENPFAFLLRIRGENLSMAAALSDYKVKVAGRPCNVTGLDESGIECHLYSPPHTPNADVTVMVGFLTLNAGSASCVYQLSSVMQATTAGAVVLLVLLTTLIASISVVSVVCLKRARRWPFTRKCRMEPNVLYTANDPFLPFDAAAAGNDVTCNHNSYWTRSLSARDRLQHLTSGQHHPHLGCDDVILDDETRRLLDDSHLLIATQRLALLDIIGQGHFGCVFRGILKFPGEKTELEVAVKTLRSFTERHGPSAVEMRTFLNEALTMREFRHQHVLRLIGIVIDSDKMPLVILPFMTHGDLLSYIRDDNNSPSVKDLMQFGIQIADGMDYLASLKFVHRDLAARNCMLDDDMMVKVADFGLSRDIYERDYYSSDDRKAKLPVKWMALESLEKGIYNTKTDVWSYGVVLWELMTRGVCPYPEVDNWDIVKYLVAGRRMPQPAFCPDALYALMLRCWDVEPSQRPIFCELSSTVAIIIAKMKAAAAASDTADPELRTAGARYVNAVDTSPIADYLRPLADRTTAESANRGGLLDLSTSAAAAAEAAAQGVDDDDNGANLGSELISTSGGADNALPVL